MISTDPMDLLERIIKRQIPILQVPDYIDYSANNGPKTDLISWGNNPANTGNEEQALHSLQMVQRHLASMPVYSQHGAPESPMTIAQAQSASTFGLPASNQASSNMSNSAAAAAQAMPAPVLGGILKNVLSSKIQNYFGNKEKQKQESEKAAIQTDYLNKNPLTRFEGPTGKQVPLSIPEQAHIYQVGPTLELQQTGNNMMQNWLAQKSQQATATPQSRIVGVPDHPELQQRESYDFTTNSWNPVGGPIGAKLPFGGKEKLDLAMKNAALNQAKFNEQLRKNVESEALSQAKHKEEQVKASNTAASREHAKQMAAFNINNPTYKKDMQTIRDEEAQNAVFNGSIDNYIAELKRYQNALPGARFNPVENGPLLQAHQGVAWGVRSKGMQNTGVLNKAEVPFLNQTLPDPTDITSPKSWGSVDSLIQQAEKLRAFSNMHVDRVKSVKAPKNTPPPPPAFIDPAAGFLTNKNKPFLKNGKWMIEE